MQKSNFTDVDPNNAQPGPQAQRILIVDDERDTALSLMAVLRIEGYDARATYEATSALKLVEEFDPDTLVVDIAMPNMSGWDLAREVRKKRLSRPMLVAISGTYVKAPDQMLCRIAGFNHFLLKPCHPEFLMSILGPPVLRS